MSVNDADNADRGGKCLVVNAVREPPQQDAAQVPPDNRLAFRRFLDDGDGVVDRVEELLGCRW